MTVIVIGGGASGMLAALTAAQNGHQVTLLERQARVGRKLLSTGNGRCNLTNWNADISHYHGQSPAFIQPAMEQFGVGETLDFFHSLGLLTVAEDSGRIYPLSDQAGSVVDVLRFALDEAGVEVQVGFEVTSLKKKNDLFHVTSIEGTVLTAQRVLVCCGGMAGGKLGGTQSGYELLKSMGHTLTKLYPALVQIKTDPTYVKSLKGVRADAEVELRLEGKVVDRSAGEVQFTEFGISGPVGFELSRTAATAKGNLVARIDLLRQVDTGAVLEALEARVRTMPHLTMENLLVGLLHNRLGRTVLRYAGYGLTEPVISLKSADLKRIAAAMKCFELPVIGVHGFDGAQVTAGGICTNEFDPQTMESKLVSGLYATGEVLDIDGDCGGYNLQWAWASGYLAGQLK